MSTHDTEVNEFLREQGAKAFSFDAIGDAVEGEITAMDLRQQTDMQTGEPKTFDDGRPRKVMVVTLQTQTQDDENDDGLRTVWIRGGNYVAVTGKGTSSLTALKDALRRAGVGDIETGGYLRFQFTGEGKASARGFNPPKLYTADYVAPKQSISLDEMGG